MTKNTLLASAATIVLLSTGSAYAQQAPAQPQASAEAPDPQAIIVTARRRAEDASKVPIAISAFSGEQLVAKGVTNVIDLVKIAPGLNIQGGATKVNPFIVIRGQSRAVTGNGSPGVITYMNDVPLPVYGSLIQSYDMENIQVLKGPQGTLFGRNTIGGAVLTVTKAPTYEFEGYVRADIAAYNNNQIEGAVNIPIVADKVALRLAAQVGHSDNHIKTYIYSPYTIDVGPGGVTATPGNLRQGNRNGDEYASNSYRASLLIEPTDWLKSVTVGDYSKVRGAPAHVNAGLFPSLYASPPSVIADILSGGNGSGNGLAGLSDAQITTILQGQGQTPEQIAGALQAVQFARLYANNIIPSLAQCPQQDVRCNVFAAAAATSNAQRDRISYTTNDPWLSRTIIKGISNTTTIKLGENHQIKNIFALRTTDSFNNVTLTGLAPQITGTPALTRLKQTTDEIQASGSFFDNDLKYTVGGFFYNEKPNGIGGYQALEVNAFFGLSHNLSTTYLHNSSQAVYGQIDYSPKGLIDGLTLTAGLRQTWDQQSACTTNKSFSPLGSAQYLVSDQSPVVPSEAECRAGSGVNIDSAQTFQDAKFKALTYTLSASWQITPSALAYITRRKGYRAGGLNTPVIDPFLSNLQTFRPETLTDWEFGTKLRFRSGGMRGSLDLAVFSGKDKNAQLPIDTSNSSQGICLVQALGAANGHPNSDCNVGGTPGALVVVNAATTTANGGELTIRGFEAAATFSPVSGLTFSGSAAYVDVSVDKVSLPVNFQTYLTAAGKSTVISLQGQPTWTANAGVTGVWPSKVLGGDLSASLDFHYTGSVRQVEITVPGYHNFDLRVALDNVGGTNLGIAAYIRNLTNETTYLGGGSSNFGLGAISYLIGPPRMIGAQLSYKF